MPTLPNTLTAACRALSTAGARTQLLLKCVQKRASATAHMQVSHTHTHTHTHTRTHEGWHRPCRQSHSAFPSDRPSGHVTAVLLSLWGQRAHNLVVSSAGRGSRLSAN